MVAPGSVDVEIAGPQPLLAESEFFDDPAAGAVLGANADLQAVQTYGAETVVGGHRHGRRHHPAPGHRLVHPVAHVARAHGAPGDAGDRQLADQAALVLDDERQHAARVGLGPQVADHLTVGRPVDDGAGRRGRRDGRLPGPQPVAVAPVDLTPGPLVAQLYRPEDDVAVHQLHGPGGAVQLAPPLRAPGRSWSPPRNWSTACRSSGSSTARPSFTPPLDPGRLTISVRPATPARPRESAAVATFSRPYARMASAMPGTSWSMTRRVASGVRSVGEMPVPPVVTTTSYPASAPARSAASTGSPSGTICGPSTVKPSRHRPSAISGPPRSA